VSGHLKFTNGVVHRIDNSTVSWIKDRNGNMVSISCANGPFYFSPFRTTAPTQITDSDGRIVNINYNDPNCSGGNCATISYQSAGGASQQIKVLTTKLSTVGALRSGYSLQTINALFPGTEQPASANFSPTVATAAQFPDGSAYAFNTTAMVSWRG
jgi:hypothetical protein